MDWGPKSTAANLEDDDSREFAERGWWRISGAKWEKSPQKRQTTSEGPSRPKYCHELVYEVGEVAEETI